MKKRTESHAALRPYQTAPDHIVWRRRRFSTGAWQIPSRISRRGREVLTWKMALSDSVVFPPHGRASIQP